MLLCVGRVVSVYVCRFGLSLVLQVGFVDVLCRCTVVSVLVWFVCHWFMVVCDWSLAGVFLWCVHSMCSFGVFLRSVPPVCSFGVFPSVWFLSVCFFFPGLLVISTLNRCS